MAQYEIIGKGSDTGRARKRVYTASSEQKAKQQAKSDGTVVESITKLPPTPPSEAQINLAQDLNIQIPMNVSMGDLSEMISFVTDKDKLPTDRHLKFADNYGVDYTQYTGKKSLFDRIYHSLLESGDENNIVAWFAFRVYRGLVSGDLNTEPQDPSHPVFQEISKLLSTNEPIIKSMRKYRGRDLIWFGQKTFSSGITVEGGSKRTMAYKTVEKHLIEKLNLSQMNITQKGKPENSLIGSDDKKGCLSVFVFMIAIPIFFITTYLVA